MPTLSLNARDLQVGDVIEWTPSTKVRVNGVTEEYDGSFGRSLVRVQAEFGPLFFEFDRELTVWREPPDQRVFKLTFRHAEYWHAVVSADTAEEAKTAFLDAPYAFDTWAAEEAEEYTVIEVE